MDIPRSTYYYKSRMDEAKRKQDTDIKDRLEELALRFPRYGYHRMTAQLKREGFLVNHKRVLRLMRELDLLCRTKRRFVRTTDSDHPYPVYPNVYEDVIITGVDQDGVAFAVEIFKMAPRRTGDMHLVAFVPQKIYQWQKKESHRKIDRCYLKDFYPGFRAPCHRGPCHS